MPDARESGTPVPDSGPGYYLVKRIGGGHGYLPTIPKPELTWYDDAKSMWNDATQINADWPEMQGWYVDDAQHIKKYEPSVHSGPGTPVLFYEDWQFWVFPAMAMPEKWSGDEPPKPDSAIIINGAVEFAYGGYMLSDLVSKPWTSIHPARLPYIDRECMPDRLLPEYDEWRKQNDWYKPVSTD